MKFQHCSRHQGTGRVSKFTNSQGNTGLALYMYGGHILNGNLSKNASSANISLVNKINQIFIMKYRNAAATMSPPKKYKFLAK